MGKNEKSGGEKRKKREKGRKKDGKRGWEKGFEDLVTGLGDSEGIWGRCEGICRHFEGIWATEEI